MPVRAWGSAASALFVGKKAAKRQATAAAIRRNELAIDGGTLSLHPPRDSYRLAPHVRADRLCNPPPPRAFSQGVGQVFQVVGGLLFLCSSSICCGSSLLSK